MSKLHPDAAAVFNAKGSASSESVEQRPQRTPPPKVPPEKSDTPIMASFTEANVPVSSYREFLRDLTGQYVACYFHAGERGMVGVSGQAHANLSEVARRMAGDRAYSTSVSERFFYDRAIDWLQDKVTRPAADSPQLVDYLESEAAKAVRRFEVWYPLPVAEITRPFHIGRTEFRRITKPMMDEYAERVNAGQSAKNEAAFDRLRSRIQAATAACVEVEAEPIRGDEIARAESEASIAIFRLPCPAMLNVYEWAPIDPSFVDGFGGPFNLHVEDKKILAHQTSLPERMCTQWLLQPDEIEHWFRSLWAFGHDLIVTKRNDFQELMLGSLVHYSRSVLKADPSERLLYVITSLEAIFIRDARESIVQNFRERMAVIMGPDVQRRLDAIGNITKVYDIRSKFVHAALPVQELTVLAEFIEQAWTTMFFLLNNHNKWASKIDFLKFVDFHKFTGPEFSTEGLPSL